MAAQSGAYVAGATLGAVIPIVGPLVGVAAGAAMSKTETAVESKTLTLTFRQGVVAACRLATMTSTSTTRYGGFGGVDQKTQGEEIPCAEVSPVLNAQVAPR